MSSTRNPHGCKEMRKLKSLLQEYGFMIEERANCSWKIWKAEGIFRIIHPSRKAYLPTLRWIKDEYGIDLDPKPVKNRARRGRNTALNPVKRPSQRGPWDKPWDDYHPWEKKFIRRLWERIKQAELIQSSDEIIPLLPNWGDPHLTKLNGNSSGKEYRKKYNSIRMDKIAEYVLSIHKQSNKTIFHQTGKEVRK